MQTSGPGTDDGMTGGGGDGFFDGVGEAMGDGDSGGDSFEGGFGLQRGVRVYSRDELRAIDAACLDEFGILGVTLMEHASAQLSEAVARLLSVFGGERVLVVAGAGNNGGDGLACARHLDAMGYAVGVVLGDRAETFGGDAAVQLEIVRRCGIGVVEVLDGDVVGAIRAACGDEMPAVVVDALFGTGLSRAAEGVGAALIDAMNSLGSDGAALVSADVPSGLDADAGTVLGSDDGLCVEADLTVSFAGLKRGFLELGAQAYLGEVVVAPIGAPRVVLERFGEEIEADWPERFGRDGGGDDAEPAPSPVDGSRGASGPESDVRPGGGPSAGG